MTRPKQSDLSEVIEGLKAREAELAKRVTAVQNDRRKSHDPSFPEQAVERENDEVLDRLDEVERKELAAVRAAIARANRGSFGVCEACEEDIDTRRLDADPAATLCIACAQAAEKSTRA